MLVRYMLSPGRLKSYLSHGLSKVVEEDLSRNITDGDFIVFCNRVKNRLKAIYWDGSGLCLFAKRLEGGRFAWPDSKIEAKEITSAELGMLLEGIDRWPRRPLASGHRVIGRSHL